MTTLDSAAEPIRLAYSLRYGSRTGTAVLLPHREAKQPALDEQELKEALPKVHALDKVILQEIKNASVFGQVNDSGLARLLPLLLQRRTELNGQQLKLQNQILRPRIKVSANPGGGVRLRMHLLTIDDEWLDIESGRLFAGDQAYFVQGAIARPVKSGAPWILQHWVRDPVRDLSDSMTPSERDQLVHDLRSAGIPDTDLQTFAVQRGAPDKICVRLFPGPGDDKRPLIHAALEAEYLGERVDLGNKTALSPYIVPQGGGGMIERDLAAEEAARDLLRTLGFRFEKQHNVFVVTDDLAMLARDANAEFFPSHWHIDRSASHTVFRHDLSVRAEVKLIEERGLLDLQVKVAVDDDTAVQALIGMKDLLAWLHTGARYVRLADGSYVAPDAGVRQSLKVLADLGADTGRALISPLCIGLLRLLNDQEALRTVDEVSRAWLQELSENTGAKPVDPPRSVASVLREYQRRGLDWMWMLHRFRLTGILADDMGLGKTLQALSLLSLAQREQGNMPSLVVAPTSVLSVWRDEATHFTPELKVVVWHGTPKERQQLSLADADLVVTSYGILRRDVAFLAKQKFRYILLDEAQSAKSASSQNAKAVRQLQSERRLALTGTPIENRPEELWTIFDFLAPGFLGTLRNFRKRYATPMSRGDQEALDILRARVQPLILRRLKAEVAPELPPKVETVARCEMLGAQRALYDHIAGRLRQSVQEKIAEVGIERAQLDILAAITRLRQVCCDPHLLPNPTGTKVPESAKLQLFEELMREALASERRVVVFSQFVEMQKRIITVIKKLGVDPLWLHGGTRNRDKVVAAFQNPSGPPIIVVSLRAGGTGLTLTRADTVMHYDPWWNPAVEQQATDRTHRLGQKHQVTVYKLVCADSIEERVLSLAKEKTQLVKDLLGTEGARGFKFITAEQVMSLLQ